LRIIGEGLTFDDVLLVPLRSSVKTRRDVDVSTRLTGNIALSSPVISAPMDTVTTSSMASSMARNGGLGIIHRFLGIEDQCAEVEMVKNASVNLDVEESGNLLVKSKNIALTDRQGRLVCGAAVGIKDTLERSAALVKAGCDVLCLDIAHAHSESMISAIRAVKTEFPDTDLIAGNIATAEAAEDLISAGADVVKVGIGPGSTCTTRIVTGCGMPQLTAIAICKEICKQNGIAMIADGGMRGSGDLVKALAAGADAGMFGGLFAGTNEAPSVLVEDGGKKFKVARGMASAGAFQSKLEIEGRLHEAHGTVPEGAEIRVPYHGSVDKVMAHLLAGLRSGMSYCNAHAIEDLQKNARFIKVSHSTQKESGPHNEFFI